MRRLARCIAIGWAGVSLLAGCRVRSESFRCTSDPQCVSRAGAGTCEPTGYCSLPDDGCQASHRRYHASAGPYAGGCVGELPPSDGGVEVSVTLLSNGLDTSVTSTPAGIDCGHGGPCSARFSAGQPVTLAVALPMNGYATFSGACSDTGGTCRFAPDADAAVTVELHRANYMFVTSTEVTPGALGGLSGADDACAAHALAAGLAGTYRAWLSTSAVDARDRLVGARGWIRPDGRPFVDTLADLTNFQLVRYPPRVDEHAVDHGWLGGLEYDRVVATGSYPNGTAYGSLQAGDWAGGSLRYNGGYLSAGQRRWTEALTRDGTTSARLYCFGIDLAEPMVMQPASGRHAFQSAAAFDPATGLSGADAICAAEAAQARLAGTFRALLATSSGSAASRFGPGAKWVRMDGVTVFETAEDLAKPGTMLAPITMQAGGALGPDDRTVWVGAPSFQAIGTATCADWTGTGKGAVGQAQRADEAGAGQQQVDCVTTTARSVYCLED